MRTSRITKKLLITLSLLTAGVSVHQPAAGQETPQVNVGDTIDDTRVLLDKWQQFRRTIVKEKNQWALTKEVLLSRIALLKRNIAEAEEELAKQKEKLSGFDDRIAELEAQNERLKESAAKLEAFVEQMEARTLKLIKGAPQPLVNEVEPLAVQMPGYGVMKDGTTSASSEPTDKPEKEAAEDAADKAQAPLSRRVENVVGVLYLFNKYAGKIDQTSELVDRPNGPSLGVGALYLGTSYGFYVDDEDKIAASGKPGAQGWTWSPIDSAALRVRQAIDVFNKDQPAAFISLPVEVTE